MAKRNLLPLFYALLTAVVLLAVTFKLDQKEREYLSQKNHADALNHLSLARARLEGVLNSRLFLTRGLAAFVANNPGVGESGFNTFAQELMKNQPGVRSIQLARDNIVSHIYPLKGNEAAMGLKLLETATSKDAVQRAMETRRTVVNGPFKLVQGGTAILSRTPIFLENGRYWGLASIMLDEKVLLADAGLDKEHPFLKFALRGKDGLGSDGEVFWGGEKIFSPDSVRLDITLPSGSWQIAAAHKDGWDSPGTLWLRHSGILLALVAALFAWFLSRNPARLREEIEHATRALKESEANFRSLLENAKDFVIFRQEPDTADPRGARITLFSPSVRDVLGISDLNDYPSWSTHIHPDDATLVDANRRTALERGETYNTQLRWHHPDKGWIWLHTISTPVFDADGKLSHFNGLILDITQQKEAEMLLRDAHGHLENEVKKRTQELEIANRQLISEIAIRQQAEQNLRGQRDLYQALLKAQSDIGEGLFIIENRRIVYANDALCQITGYDPGELRALPSFDQLVPPDLRDTVMEKHLRRIAGEQFENRYEFRILTKSGVPREVEVAAATMPGNDGLAVVVVMQDISRRKQIENELKRQVRFTQTLIDAIPNPIFFKDVEGHYLGCNKAFESALGMASDEVVGKTVYDFNPSELATIYQGMDDTLFTSGGLQIYEAKVLFADGKRHDILFYKSLFTDTDNQVAGLVGVMLDITTRKAAEEELRLARDELELRVAERTRELARANQELTGEITERRRLETEIIHVSEEEQKRIGQELHDGLGQHLTGIAFLAKALEQKLATMDLNEKLDATQIVQLVNQSISRTRALARGLFPVELESNGLMAALEQLAVNIHTLYGIPCTFQCEEPVLVYDNVVGINLYRIAQEAAGNAVKHGQTQHILIELKNTGKKVYLAVTDDGGGYDPAAWENSSGMGIHIMQYRAKMIGSSLEIHKAPLQGTTISILADNPDKP